SGQPEAAAVRWIAMILIGRPRPHGVSSAPELLGKGDPMRYAIICYHDETAASAWSKDEADAVMAKRAKVGARLAAEGKLCMSVALKPTTTAVTVRPSAEPLITDGPFAETKEQLLGVYIVECDALAEVTAIAQEIGQGETGALEVRPLHLFVSAVAS